MADVLTHVLVGFVAGMALSFHYDWIDLPLVVVVMAGALLPDVTKIHILIPPATVERMLGVPFDWFALHTPVGSVCTAGVAALLVDKRNRRRVFSLLILGVATHFVLDGLLITPSRFYHVLLWPFSTRHIALPGLYLSSDPWTAGVAAAIGTALVFLKWRTARR